MYDGNDADGEADDGEDEDGCCCAGVDAQDDGDGAEEFGPGDAAGDVGDDRVGEDFKSFDAEGEGLRASGFGRIAGFEFLPGGEEEEATEGETQE